MSYGLFEDIQAFDDGKRVAHRQVIAVAAKRIADQIGPFLDKATGADRQARLALVQDDVRQIIADVAEEQDYEGDLNDLREVIEEDLAGDGVTDINGELADAPSAVGTRALAAAEDEDEEDEEAEEESDGPFEGAAPPFEKKADAVSDAGGAVKTVDLPTANDAGDLGDNSGPKLDKKEWGSQKPVDSEMSGTPHPTVHQDLIEEDPNWDGDFLDQTDAVTEQQDLPSAGDDANVTERNVEQPSKAADQWTGTEGLASPVGSARESFDAGGFMQGLPGAVGLGAGYLMRQREVKQLEEQLARAQAELDKEMQHSDGLQAQLPNPEFQQSWEREGSSDPDKNPIREILSIDEFVPQSQAAQQIAEYEGE